jgi:biotin carboxyl carrier protein
MSDDPKAPSSVPPDADPARARRDHQAISNLADDLLPALIAKLASSGLGEIEVREGGWRARLRKPAGPDITRRSAVRSTADGHAGSGHSAGRHQAQSRPAQPVEGASDQDAAPIAATSPAVGIYHPRRDLSEGMRVRTAEKIGIVDVLGVNQDVLVPVDGIIGTSLAEAGEAVEYGQELVRIELTERGAIPNKATDEPDPAGARGKA